MPSVWAVSNLFANEASSQRQPGRRFVVSGPDLAFLAEPLVFLVGRLRGIWHSQIRRVKKGSRSSQLNGFFDHGGIYLAAGLEGTVEHGHGLRFLGRIHRCLPLCGKRTVDACQDFHK
jgi:hypothetical protein